MKAIICLAIFSILHTSTLTSARPINVPQLGTVDGPLAEDLIPRSQVVRQERKRSFITKRSEPPPKKLNLPIQPKEYPLRDDDYLPSGTLPTKEQRIKGDFPIDPKQHVDNTARAANKLEQGSVRSGSATGNYPKHLANKAADGTKTNPELPGRGEKGYPKNREYPKVQGTTLAHREPEPPIYGQKPDGTFARTGAGNPGPARATYGQDPSGPKNPSLAQHVGKSGAMMPVKTAGQLEDAQLRAGQQMPPPGVKPASPPPVPAWGKGPPPALVTGGSAGQAGAAGAGGKRPVSPVGSQKSGKNSPTKERQEPAWIQQAQQSPIEGKGKGKGKATNPIVPTEGRGRTTGPKSPSGESRASRSRSPLGNFANPEVEPTSPLSKAQKRKADKAARRAG